MQGYEQDSFVGNNMLVNLYAKRGAVLEAVFDARQVKSWKLGPL